MKSLNSLACDHANLVASLRKPGSAIVDDLTPIEADMLHMAVGVSGEAGELLDAIKKVVIYKKPVDRENVVEELGDLEFYMEGLRQDLGISRDETIEANIAKLNKRYAAGYSNQAAQERADKTTSFRTFLMSKIGDYSDSELMLGGHALLDSLPFKAPWLSPFGVGFINVIDVRRVDGVLEFQLAGEDCVPYENGNAWCIANCFYEEWPD